MVSLHSEGSAGLTLVRRCSKERTRRHSTPTCTTSKTARRTISSSTRMPKFPHQARTRLLSPHRLRHRRLRARPARHRYRLLPPPPSPLTKHRLVLPLVGVTFGEFCRTANSRKSVLISPSVNCGVQMAQLSGNALCSASKCIGTRRRRGHSACGILSDALLQFFTCSYAN